MAANFFLKFEPDDGLKSESKQAGFEGQIEVQNFGWSIHQAGGFSYGSGGGVAKADLGDMSIEFVQCSASPTIMVYCVSGKHLDKATLTCLKAGGKQEPYLIIEMEDVLISGYDTEGPYDPPIYENLTLNFAKVTQRYLSQEDSGQTIEAGTGTWDQRTASNA